MSIPQLPAAKILGTLIGAQMPPTQPKTTHLKQPGNLILDRAQCLAVNNTGTAVGSGATQVAPWTCTVSWNATVYYSVPWIGDAPTVGTVSVLSQPPLLYVIGSPSNVTSGGGGGGGGESLSNHHWAGGVSASMGTTGFTALDTTNLIIPAFTYPASGLVEVDMSLYIGSSIDSTAAVAFALYTHVTPTKVGTTWLYGITPTVFPSMAMQPFWRLSGTPGAVQPALDLYGFSTTSATQVFSQDTGGTTSSAPSGAGVPYVVVVWAI